MFTLAWSVLLVVGLWLVWDIGQAIGEGIAQKLGL